MGVWPVDATWNEEGQLLLGGLAATDLAAEFGTPLYVYSEATLRERAWAFRDAFTAAWPRTRIAYAAKAFMSLAVVRILHQEGLGLDVSSGGELYAGLTAGVPATEMTFHGNAKTERELQEALAAGIGLIAVDNLSELNLLARLAASDGIRQRILLRLNPGIDVHTHAKIKTGVLDSKFGLPITTGDAAEAVAQAVAAPSLQLAGYHTHLGSQLFDPPALAAGIDALLGFAAEMRDAHGIGPEVISPGGGFGIPYEGGTDETPIADWATAIGGAMERGCRRFDLAEPELVIEPGRSIAGPAGVALYRVGPVKDVPGVARFVAVDGGMADNIRPALYGARYDVAIANRRGGGPDREQTIVGKYCESGDVLIDRAMLPEVTPGDVLAIPATGAYCLAMASNYNLALRPAVVLVGGGDARLIRHRETYADLMRAEVPLDSPGGAVAEHPCTRVMSVVAYRNP